MTTGRHVRPESIAKMHKEFIDQFLSDGSARVWSLVSDPMSGKTYVAMELLRRLLDRSHGGHWKALVICPAPLVTRWIEQASEVTSNRIRVLALNRKEFVIRFQEAGSTVADHTVVYVASRSMLQMKDVMQRVLEESWDLVIVDEAQFLGQRNEMATDLISTVRDGRLLFLSGIPLPISGIERVHSFDVPLDVPLDFPEELLHYQPTDAELKVLEAIRARLPSNSSGHKYRMMMLRAADSSLFALSDSVQRLLSRLSPQPIEEATSDKADDRLTLDEDSRRWIDNVSQLIEEVDSDSKLEALVVFLRSSVQQRNVHILTQWKGTADYLAESLKMEGFDVAVVTGAMTAEGKMQALRESQAQSSILIMTDVMNCGCRHSSPDLVIEYDQSLGSRGRYLRRARYESLEEERTSWVKLVREERKVE
jgi:SNF2 family DNA or RNA helicase